MTPLTVQHSLDPVNLILDRRLARMRAKTKGESG
jgi:hypothetical protein